MNASDRAESPEQRATRFIRETAAAAACFAVLAAAVALFAPDAPWSTPLTFFLGAAATLCAGLTANIWIGLRSYRRRQERQRRVHVIDGGQP